MPKRTALLSPRIDAVFKRLMGDVNNISPLIGFLQAALDLPEEDYARVQLLDPHVMGEAPGDKLGILDVRLETATGKQIDIEIQMSALPEMPARILFYLGRMITGQVCAGKGYDHIKRSICILIADYVQIPGVADYHNCYRLYNRKNGSLFTDLLEINVLELPKLPAESDGSALCWWGRFFRATEEEEFEMLAKKDEAIGVAVGRLKELSRDDSLRLLAESRQIAQWDEESRMRGAMDEGLARGRQEGRQEGQQKKALEIARKLLVLNLPLPAIQDATGLSQGEILMLQAEGQRKH
jgi:predicted transposase/invertase (TIGR01784 family)